MQQTQTYRQRSRNFLVKARAELDAGDLEQASEKGWGAAAAIVKAIAQDRSWAHRGHRELQDAVNQLVDETRDGELAGLFDSAAQLHRNFYENWFSLYRVQLGIVAVERFVDKMEPLLDNSG